MTFIQITIVPDDVKTLRPDWSDLDCDKFLERYGNTIYSSLSQYGRELLENFVALQDIEYGAINNEMSDM